MWLGLLGLLAAFWGFQASSALVEASQIGCGKRSHRIASICDVNVRVAPAVVPTQDERLQLERYARGRSVAVRVAQRAKLLLLAPDGQQGKEVAKQLGTAASTVARWRSRFLARARKGAVHRLGVGHATWDAPRGCAG